MRPEAYRGAKQWMDSKGFLHKKRTYPPLPPTAGAWWVAYDAWWYEVYDDDYDYSYEDVEGCPFFCWPPRCPPSGCVGVCAENSPDLRARL